MTENFTPGQWEVQSRYTDCETSKTRIYSEKVIATSEGYIISSIETKDKNLLKMIRANAALIAAAPEMYRALETVLALCEGGLLQKTRCDILGAEIDELLKKARGDA